MKETKQVASRWRTLHYNLVSALGTKLTQDHDVGSTAGCRGQVLRFHGITCLYVQLTTSC